MGGGRVLHAPIWQSAYMALVSPIWHRPCMGTCARPAYKVVLMPRWLSIYMVSPLPGNPPWYMSLLGLGQFDLQGLDLHIVVETILLVPALVLKSTSEGGVA